jgi:hypothetical protein
MRFHKQLISGDNGYGDCARTAVACLIDAETVGEVPHFFSNDEPGEIGWQLARDWLALHGYGLFFIGLAPVSVAEVLATVGAANPDQYYMLMGSVAGGGTHVVICHGTKMVHNPSWGGNGIVGPLPEPEPHYLIAMIVPANQTLK